MPGERAGISGNQAIERRLNRIVLREKRSAGRSTAKPAAKQQGLAASFAHYLPIVGDAVQSGNGRVVANDDNTDFYTVPLTQETLRPGTVYADPYGHVMMLVRRVPQSGGAAGVFLAVDGEPDGCLLYTSRCV